MKNTARERSQAVKRALFWWFSSLHFHLLTGRVVGGKSFDGQMREGLGGSPFSGVIKHGRIRRRGPGNEAWR